MGCFQNLAIVNNTTLNIGVHRCFWIGCPGFLGYNSSRGIAGSSILVFWGNSILFSVVVAPVCIPTNSALFSRVLFSPQPHQHLLFVDLFIMAIPTNVKWHFIVVFICISLMASDAKHPFICLWALCMSSLEKCLFRSFARFLTGLFVFLVWSHMSSLYISANIFSHTVGYLFF